MADRKLTVVLAGKADDLHRTLDSASSKISGFGGHVTNAAKTVAVGFAAMTGAAAIFGKSAIDAASSLSETMAKSNVVFGEQAKEIEKWASKSSTAFGQSKQQALDAAATYGNLFQAFGVGRKESAEMSTSLVELAADLASFNDVKNVDDVLVALRSGLSGETEPLKRFGIAINATRLQAEALKMGLAEAPVDMLKVEKATIKVEKATAAYNESVKRNGMESAKTKDAALVLASAQQKLEDEMAGGKVTLTEAQKAQAAYALIMKDSALAQGDFARTSDSLANRIRTLKGQFTDLKAEIGMKLLPVAQAVATWMSTVMIPAVEKFAPIIEKKLTPVLKGLGEVGQSVFGWMKEHVPPVFDWLKEHVPPILDAIGDRVERLAGWFRKELVPAIGEAAEAFREHIWPILKEKVAPVLAEVAEFLEKKVIPWLGALAVFIIGVVVPAIMSMWGWIDTVLVPAIVRFVDKIKEFGKNLMDFFRSVRDEIDKSLGPIDEWLSKAGSALSKISGLFGSGSTLSSGGGSSSNGNRGDALAKKLSENAAGVGWPEAGHTGGTFHAPRPGGVGLALLRDGERVSVPGMGGSGGVTIVVQGSVITERELVDVMARARARGVRGI